MKRISSILFLSLILLSCGSDPVEKKPSATAPAADTTKDVPVQKDGLDFNYFSVIAYATVDAVPENIDPVKKIGPDTVSHLLSLDDLAALREAVNSVPPDSQAVADCFMPRHFILFLDRSGKIVEHIAICFECTRMKSSRPELGGNLRNFETFFEGIGLPVFAEPEKHEQYYRSVVKTRQQKR